MAILHDATLTPATRQLIGAWVPGPTWFDSSAGRNPLGTFPFGDPAGWAGAVGFQPAGQEVPPLLVPVSHRAPPLALADARLVGTTEHSVMGPRWVYDGCAAPVAVSALLPASATGGHEAALTMEKDGETVTFEPTCRVV